MAGQQGIVTQFWDNVKLEKPPSPKRKRHDNLQAPTSPKKIRYDVDDGAYNMLPPRLPPKLNGPETLFVEEEPWTTEEPPLTSLPLKRGSPWEHYVKAYRRELGASVVVAYRIKVTFELFAVKDIVGSDINKRAEVLRQISHKNFVACHEIYVSGDTMFTVSECMAISLADLNGSAIPPNEAQIATIVYEASRSYQISWW